MPQESLKPGLRVALRLHEIGDASPYRLSFAGKGKSGGSFGFMQGDLAAGQTDVTQTFRTAMTAAGISAAQTDSLVQRLSVHLIVNPLSPMETDQVNGALLSSRQLVDKMDESILQNVYGGLDRCVATAGQTSRSIAPKSQIYMALWINMTGPPSKLLIWLSGGNPGLETALPSLGSTVDGPTMEGYLRATSYYTENPGNLPHMLQCAAAGMAAIATGANVVALAAAG
jgi:hypothetical protein